ncbi:MAG: T9SS type A sorting domain-containing protein [Bacteroidota bacterium]
MNYPFLYTLLFLCLLSTADSLIAQGTNPYRIEVEENVAYNDLVDPTSLNQGQTWDDPNYTMPLGFDFNFFGSDVNTLYTIDMFLGGTLTDANLFNANGDANAIMAYGSDLIDRGTNSGNSVSEVSYKTEGEPGERIFKMEWKNTGYYNEVVDLNIDSSFINLQVWIYEGSNDIEVHFGPGNYFSSNSVLHEGNDGPLMGLITGINASNETFDTLFYLSGPLTDPSFSSIDIFSYYSDIPALLEGNPADGTVYRFTTSPTVGIRQLNLRQDLVKVYPTTVEDILYVEALDIFEGGYGQLRVSDAMGQVLVNQTFEQGWTSLDLSSLASGMYIVEIQMDEELQTQKFFKR